MSVKNKTKQNWNQILPLPNEPSHGRIALADSLLSLCERSRVRGTQLNPILTAEPQTLWNNKYFFT